MARTVKAEDFTWLPREEACTPRNGDFQVYVDYWWVVNDEGAIALYRRVHPQCNRLRAVVQGALLPIAPGADRVEQIPVVFLPHRCEDYR